MFPKEYDNLIAEAKAQIQELKNGGDDNAAVVAQLRENIRVWKSEKLGVELPQLKPVSKPKPAPTRKSDLNLENVLSFAKKRSIPEPVAREFFAENEHDPTVLCSDWRNKLADRWHYHRAAR